MPDAGEASLFLLLTAWSRSHSQYAAININYRPYPRPYPQAYQPMRRTNGLARVDLSSLWPYQCSGRGLTAA
jgi:hypothetical protein